MINYKKSIGAMFAALLFFSQGTRAAQPPRLLLLDIQPKGVEKSIAESLTGLLALEVEQGGLFTVISREDIKTLLKVEQDRLMLGEIDGHEQMMSKLAQKLKAPFVLASSLGKVGHAYVLTLTLLDAEKIQVVRRVNQTLVGDKTGLAGSIRTAALALNLEQKGTSPDISDQLLDSLAISEKAKSWFISISPVYEAPLGYQKSDDDIMVFRPDYIGARLDVDLAIWKWIRAFASLGASFSVNAQEHQETNDIAVIYGSGQDPTSYWTQGSGFSVDYTSMRIPLVLGIKAIPQRGRFLPFALVGIGASYISFNPSDGNLDVFREQQSGSCAEPFQPETSGKLDVCILDDLAMKPDSGISELGMELVAGAGAEYLLTHFLGIKAQLTYELTYLFKSDSDLRVPFRGEVNTSSGHQELGKLLAAKNIYHHLAFTAGLVVYW